MRPTTLSNTHQVRVSRNTCSPYRRAFFSEPSWVETRLSKLIPVQAGHDVYAEDDAGRLSDGWISRGSFIRTIKHVSRTIPRPESQPRVAQSVSTKTLTMAVLGSSVPPFTPHAISVCLPTWKDNVGYEEGEKRVVDSMVTGYPRFFIHRSIQKVCASPMLVYYSPSRA